MEIFFKIWQSVDGEWKFGLGVATFILAMTSVIVAAGCFDATVGKWASHRWPGPKRDDDEKGDDE